MSDKSDDLMGLLDALCQTGAVRFVIGTREIRLYSYEGIINTYLPYFASIDTSIPPPRSACGLKIVADRDLAGVEQARNIFIEILALTEMGIYTFNKIPDGIQKLLENSYVDQSQRRVISLGFGIYDVYTRGLIGIIQVNNTFLYDAKLGNNEATMEAVEKRILETVNRNKAFNDKVVIYQQKEISFINKSNMGGVESVFIPTGIDVANDFRGNLGADQYTAIAQTALRAQIAESISRHITSGGGTKHLLALSKAAKGGGTSFLSIAPNGTESSTYLTEYDIDPTILQMSGGDPMVNTYINALSRIANREKDVGEKKFILQPTPRRLKISVADLNEYINEGFVQCTDMYKGRYKIIRRVKYATVGDMLILDRGLSGDGSDNSDANALRLKNVSWDQDDVTKERFELDLPLAPTAKVKRRKKKKGGGKTSTKAKTGGKRKRNKNGKFAKK